MGLEVLVVDGGESGVRGCTGPADAEVFDVVESEGCSCAARCGDGEEVGAVDIGEREGWAGVGGGVGDFDVAHFEVAHVAEEEAAGGGGAKSFGIGVVVFLLGGRGVGIFGRSAADGLDVDVGELDVFDEMAGDASEDRCLAGRVVALEVADEDALEGAHLSGFFWAAEAAAEAGAKAEAARWAAAICPMGDPG